MFGVYPHVWGEELLRWHKFFEYGLHSSNNVLASLAGYGVWGRGVPPVGSVTSMSIEGPLSFSGARLGYPNGSNMPTAHS
jgi:hypothetical protein